MTLKKTLLIATSSILMWGCDTESTTAQNTTTNNQNGSAQISISAAKVGQLARSTTLGPSANINLSKLILTLSAPGETSISDTIALSGSGSSQVIRQFNDLKPLKTWTVTAKSLDSKDSIIHQGGTSFDVQPARTANVSLDLNAKYSMLKAQFTPIRNSVTSIHLLLDGLAVGSTSFASGSQSSLILDYDYMSANAPVGVAHNVKLQAKGLYWGLPYTLYEGQIDINVLSGRDTSYIVNLAWVGPGEAPLGAANMTVNLGNIGTVSVNGQLANDPHSVNAVGFTGAFAANNWTVTGTCAGGTSFSGSTLSFMNCAAGGMTSSITIPANGVINFDWNMNVIVSGQYGDNIRYSVNGVETYLSTAGSSAGSKTGIVVHQGDIFQFITWGTTQSSRYYGSFTNFSFTGN